jgi:uroporphyrinogen decarboxylase
MPILDRLVESGAHALHSLDPQGGVDIAHVVDRVGDRIALCGNVNCGLLQSGTDEQCIESARYALEHGKRAPGYIFSTSNCIYTGMSLQRYDLILDVWRRHGIRQ